MNDIIRKILLWIFIWSGTRLFNQIEIKTYGDDEECIDWIKFYGSDSDC